MKKRILILSLIAICLSSCFVTTSCKNKKNKIESIEIYKETVNVDELDVYVGDEFTLKLYESFLNYIDDKFKHSKERKLNYNIKETRKRTLITSIGYITVNSVNGSANLVNLEKGMKYLPSAYFFENL